MYCHCCLCLMLSMRVEWLHGGSSESFTLCSLCKSFDIDCNTNANPLSIFIWELFPEWIFPLLTGLSIACISAPNNVVVSQVFGGSNGNEGLGFLSISFDWQVSVKLPRESLLLSESVTVYFWHYEPYGYSTQSTGKTSRFSRDRSLMYFFE